MVGPSCRLPSNPPPSLVTLDSFFLPVLRIFDAVFRLSSPERNPSLSVLVGEGSEKTAPPRRSSLPQMRRYKPAYRHPQEGGVSQSFFLLLLPRRFFVQNEATLHRIATVDIFFPRCFLLPIPIRPSLTASFFPFSCHQVPLFSASMFPCGSIISTQEVTAFPRALELYLASRAAIARLNPLPAQQRLRREYIRRSLSSKRYPANVSRSSLPLSQRRSTVDSRRPASHANSLFAQSLKLRPASRTISSV